MNASQPIAAISHVPAPVNEPVHEYAPGSPERARLTTALDALVDDAIDLPHVIGGAHVMGDGERIDVVQPHRHSAVLGTLTNAGHGEASAAVEAAIAAKDAWAATPFDERAAVFLRAADLLAGHLDFADLGTPAFDLLHRRIHALLFADRIETALAPEVGHG